MRPVLRVIGVTAALLVIGPPAQAQHLYWDLEGQKDATCLYGTITVLATHRDIYYCGAGWHLQEPGNGYSGIQHNSDKERRTIFSIWDTTPQLHPRTTEIDPDAMFHRFGSEGSGEHTSRVWPWKVGEPFEFLLQKRNTPDGKFTDARFYVYDRSAKKWRQLSTIRSPGGGHKSVETIGGTMYSFLENYMGKDKEVPKLALFRLWLGKSVDELKPLTKSGGDGVWGQLDDAYFLAEGEEKRLDAVFRSVEKKYGKPTFAREGQKLDPTAATPLPTEVVKALKALPRADAVERNSDDPRDDGTFVIRGLSTRKGFVVGRDGTVSQLAVGKGRVVWKLNQVGGHYQIVNTANGLVLDGSGDRPTLRRSNGADGQLWGFEKAGDGYHIRCKEKGRVLDLAGGEQDGTPLVMWELKKPPEDWNQLWMLDDQQRSADPRAGATYTLHSVLTRKSPSVEKPPGEDGSKLVQFPTSKSPVWKLEKDGDYYRIVNAANGLVLDGSAEQVAQRKPNGSANQLWGFVKAGDAYQIKCKETGRVLDVSGESADDGTPIVTWPLKEPPSRNQLWMLIEAKKK